jgi:hypothetical protein
MDGVGLLALCISPFSLYSVKDRMQGQYGVKVRMGFSHSNCNLFETEMNTNGMVF